MCQDTESVERIVITSQFDSNFRQQKICAEASTQIFFVIVINLFHNHTSSIIAGLDDIQAGSYTNGSHTIYSTHCYQTAIGSIDCGISIVTVDKD